MPYTPNPAWEDHPSTDTPITAAALQNMEDGIDTAHDAIDNHIADTVDAHDASAISVSAAGSVSSTDVQSAIVELDSEKTALTTFNDHSARHESGGADEISIAGLAGTPTALTDHLNDTVDAHDASAISVTPAGTISSTQVQAALEELAGDITAGGMPATLFDNKGELLGATAADTVGLVTAATADDLVLTSDSAQPTGMKWAAATAGGSQAATFIVAASNANADVIAGADYTCDGTDDDVQINAAIQALPAWGGRVLLSEGTFYIGAPVLLDQNYTALEGTGRISTELSLQNTENVDVVQITGQLCTVRSFSVNGNSANNASAGNGIKSTNTKNVIEDVWITSCRENGILVTGTVGTPAHANRIRDCFVTLCVLDGVALSSAYAYDAIVDNVWSGDNGQHGFSTASSEQRFVNCHGWSSGTDGLRITATTQITVIGCYFETNAGRGIRATGGSDRVRIIGCHLYRNTSNGVYGFNSDYWLIQGCHFTENGFGTGGVPGISMDTGTNWVVNGNIFKDAQGTKTQTYAMTDVGGADYIIFSDNMALAADHKTGTVSLAATNRIVQDNHGPTDYPSTTSTVTLGLVVALGGT